MNITDQEMRVNEHKRLATGLRSMAAATFEEAARLAVVPRNVKAAKQGVWEAAVMRNIASLIEEGTI
jgi:hypothetical protein